jgi:hypothetical protein
MIFGLEWTSQTSRTTGPEKKVKNLSKIRLMANPQRNIYEPRFKINSSKV